MKKLFAAITLALISTALLLGWRTFQNYAPDMPPETFDASRYEFTYAPQEIKLKPQDRNWILRAVQSYTADGELESEIVYQFDEDGRAYLMNGDDRVYFSYNQQSNFRMDVTPILCGWDIQSEQFDEYGRLTEQKARFPYEIPGGEASDHLSVTYCPGEPTEDLVDSISGLVWMDVWSYDSLEMSHGYVYNYKTEQVEPAIVGTNYSIFAYDHYGNQTVIWMDTPCCRFLTDRAGYLQLIVEKKEKTSFVRRTDPSGRPLWFASYKDQDGSLIRYTIWEYEELEQEG